jgi:regulator of protease activity HflC (stomatin/prohibitin superfamily)
VHIEQFGIIGAPRPPDNVREAINLKVQAAQIALQKQNEVASAEADARKIIAAADGQAQANRKLTESITPQLIEWQRLAVQDRWINRWNGYMPTVEAGNNPMLFQVNPK